MMRRIAWALGAVLIGATSCVDFLSDCTLIGCEGKLTITFNAPPTGTFHLEAISVTNGVRTFDCTDVTRCTSVELSGYTPDRLVVTLTTASGTAQFNLAPQYQNTYSNGRRCGVTCRSATIAVTLP